MDALQIQDECVDPPVPSSTYGKVEEAVIRGDCRAVAELLRSAEGQAAVDISMRTALARTAARRGQPECLRVIFEMGVNLDGSVGLAAAAAGSLPCLCVAYGHGDLWTWDTMSNAAYKGHASCLLYLLKHGRSVWTDEGDDAKVQRSLVLHHAITGGHLACVEVLVAHGLPHESCMFSGSLCPDKPVGVRRLRCLEHVLDEGIPIHPGTLISAARRGDLETLRFLHSRGAPLWRAAYDEEAEEDPPPTGDLRPVSKTLRCFLLYYGVITVPHVPDDADSHVGSTGGTAGLWELQSPP